MRRLRDVLPSVMPGYATTPRWPVATYCESCQAAVCACPRCHGAGYYRAALGAVDGPEIGREVRCDCRTREVSRRAAERLAGLSILSTLPGMTFDAFDPSVAGLGEAHAKATTFAAEPVGWLVLNGPVGIGKTHLAAAIGHVLAERGEGVVMQFVPDLLSSLRRASRPDTAEDRDAIRDAYAAVPILILDDFGSERANDFAKEQLRQIVDARHRGRLPLVVTTNGLGGFDPMIASRLSDEALAVTVTIQADDYRKLPLKWRMRLIS